MSSGNGSQADLWPRTFQASDTVPPATILREQAKALAGHTSGLVEGRVVRRMLREFQSPAAQRPEFEYELQLHVPRLKYSYGLLTISHGVECYPVKVALLDRPDTETVAGTEAEFAEALRTVFASRETQNLIGLLMVEVEAVA